MKKRNLLISFILICCLCGCGQSGDKNNSSEIKFATCADYPPFEYISDGKLVGFDIELASLIAKQLGKTAHFEDMQFSSIVAAVGSKTADAGIAAIAVTPKHQEKFDFSTVYHKSDLALVFTKKHKISNISKLSDKKIACQLGTTMEIWLKKNITDHKNIVIMDNNNQAIEALKVGHVSGVLMNQTQGVAFINKNSELDYFVIPNSDEGYGIMLPKNSQLTNQINNALKELQKSGEFDRLKNKWLKLP